MCGSAMPRGLGGGDARGLGGASEEGAHVCGSRQWMCAHVHRACRHVHVVPAFGVGNIRCRRSSRLPHTAPHKKPRIRRIRVRSVEGGGWTAPSAVTRED